MSDLYKLVCALCDEEVNDEAFVSRCEACRGPIKMEYSGDKEFDKSAPISSEKYKDFFPLRKKSEIVTLEEGDTPLYRALNLGKNIGLKNLYIKNEGANPTGVFKDRGSAIEITKALEVGAKAICIASSGNMAASVAAYSAKAGLPCYVLIPEDTPIGKLVQVVSYGARVIQLKTDYSECVRLAEALARSHGFYPAGDYVYRREGQKSCAYEIVEQLEWQAPDVVVCPVGCGTNLAALYRGFQDFKEIGLIERIPRLVAVQPEGCDPVVRAFEKGQKRAEVIRYMATICSAVAVKDPFDSVFVLEGLKKSNGAAFRCADVEALEAQALLARTEGVFTEPSGALGVAVLGKIREAFSLKGDETVVVVATGNGLKDPRSVQDSMEKPPVVEPEMKLIKECIASFENK